MSMTKEQLFRATTEPGLMSLEELQEVKIFLINLNDMLNLYKSAIGEPQGQSVDSKLDQLNTMINYKINNPPSKKVQARRYS